MEAASLENELARAMERALAERTADAAWSHLTPFRASLLENEALAASWVTLLQASPAQPFARDDVRAVLERFGAGDPTLAAAAITAWVRIDERRGADEPVPADAPAAEAAGVARELLDRLAADQDADRDPARGGALRIAYANALRRLGSSRDPEAVRVFEEAITRAAGAGARAPGEWLADLGLCHKWAGRFRAALACFDKAIALEGERRPWLFNAAICAIGCGDGARAAQALRALGFEVEQQEGRPPAVAGMKPMQLRMPTRGPGHALLEGAVPESAASMECVWVELLSPVHGVIASPTFRDAIADWGDLVLWDAAPVSQVVHEGRTVPVFPLLAVLDAGSEHRLRFVALEQEAGQLAAIGAELPDGALLYEHGRRVERICARCASGEVLTKHEHEAPSEHRGVFGKLLVPPAVPLSDVRSALEKALRARSGVLLAIPRLYERLGDTARAGREHKTWGAIARGVLRKTSV